MDLGGSGGLGFGGSGIGFKLIVGYGGFLDGTSGGKTGNSMGEEGFDLLRIIDRRSPSPARLSL